jgi:hypothetical protein
VWQNLCRLEVEHTDATDEATFRQEFRAALLGNVYREQEVHNADGSYSMIFHVIKEGEAVPSLD